jgi:ubiquinone/menaquinone biosynthesis C-methylase UbiE
VAQEAHDNMKTNSDIPYLCPYTRQPLRLDAREVDGDEVRSGILRAPDGHGYAIEEGIPQLIDFARESFSAPEQRELDFYQNAAADYDATMEWVFRSFHENEDEVREAMLQPLRVEPKHRVLETGCGTCRDSIRIARRLDASGRLFLQDLSPSMLRIGKDKIDAMHRAGEIACPVEFFTGNAMTLPFPDGFFDAAFHFGGINVFSDVTKAVAEMARVVRRGGRVVFGDEGLAPWLREDEYGRILMNSSPLYEFEAPLQTVPPSARDVSVQWVIGNAYYLVAFTVGEGAPALDLDLPIVGRRGGTHRTRYYGTLEGVTPETKGRVLEAAAQQGVTIHQWLERALSDSLRKQGGEA